MRLIILIIKGVRKTHFKFLPNSQWLRQYLASKALENGAIPNSLLFWPHAENQIFAVSRYWMFWAFSRYYSHDSESWNKKRNFLKIFVFEALFTYFLVVTRINEDIFGILSSRGVFVFVARLFNQSPLINVKRSYDLSGKATKLSHNKSAWLSNK